MRRFYREIREMIETSLLQTHTARDIVRKSGVRAGTQEEILPTFPSPRLAGQYSFVEQFEDPELTQYGSVLNYLATGTFMSFGFSDDQLFPDNTWHIEHDDEFGDITQARLLVTVSRVASTSSVTLYPEMHQLLSEPAEGEPPREGGNIQLIGFVGGPPTVSLSSVGLHVTDWKEIDYIDDPNPARPARVWWKLNNPSGAAGTVGIGLCQCQIRGG
jgi:hypothetical protein